MPSRSNVSPDSSRNAEVVPIITDFRVVYPRLIPPRVCCLTRGSLRLVSVPHAGRHRLARNWCVRYLVFPRGTFSVERRPCRGTLTSSAAPDSSHLRLITTRPEVATPGSTSLGYPPLASSIRTHSHAYRTGSAVEVLMLRQRTPSLLTKPDCVHV